MILKKSFLILFLISFSYVFSQLYLKGIGILFEHSNHALLVGGLLVVGFIVYGIGIILNRRDYYFYVFLLFFPFYSIYQRGINIVMLFAVFFLFAYKTKLLVFFKDKPIKYSQPFYLVYFSIIVSLTQSTYPLEALGSSFKYTCYFIVLLSFIAEVDSIRKIKGVFSIMSILLILGGG